MTPSIEATTLQEIEKELDSIIKVAIVGAVIAEQRRTGKVAGCFRCPRCKSGTLAWSVTETGSVHALCMRTIDLEQRRYCVEFLE